MKHIKEIITAAGSTLSSFLGVLYIPTLLMVICNIIDYATGLMAAKYRADGTISSYKSFRGIAKKVSMWLLVVVGAIIDQLIFICISDGRNHITIYIPDKLHSRNLDNMQ